MLSREEKELVFKQCELQAADSPAEISNFGEAYLFARELAPNLQMRDGWGWWELIHKLAKLVMGKPVSIRSIPVVFGNGNHGLSHRLIPKAMMSLCEAVHEHRITPLDAYIEFEKIHPFEDGNGRVGHLLWATLTEQETGTWPVSLPPNVFG